MMHIRDIRGNLGTKRQFFPLDVHLIALLPAAETNSDNSWKPRATINVTGASFTSNSVVFNYTVLL